MNKRSWQRLLLSLIGIVLIGLCWFAAVQHLYTLKPEALSAFTAITTNAFYVIGAIIIFMVSGRLIYEWKNSTSSIVQTVSETLAERTPKSSHYDDGSLP